jgi:tagatose-6-phosphate ketose/aldose isomerase
MGRRTRNFEQLLTMPESEKYQKGIQYTPAEIAQQPEMWLKMVDIFAEQGERIRAFLREAGLTGDKEATGLLSGAGSSEYIGNAVAYGLCKNLQRPMLSVASTDFVTCPWSFLLPGQPYVVISFARSGNSPESVTTYNAAGARQTTGNWRQKSHARLCRRVAAVYRPTTAPHL